MVESALVETRVPSSDTSRMRGGERFQKEVLGSTSISGRAQPKIERLSLRIDRPIQVHPQLFYLDIGARQPARSPSYSSNGNGSADQVQEHTAEPSDKWSCDPHATHIPASFLRGHDS